MLILVAALAVRIGFVVAFERLDAVRLGGRRVESPAEQPLFPDSDEYLRMADNILLGRGLVVSDGCRIGRMPGYAMFLAAVESASGRSLFAVRLVQAVVGAGTVWLLFLLAREMFGQREALAAAAVAAAYPLFIMYTALVLSETVFIALLVWGALCLTIALKHERAVSAVLAGVFFGLATLVRASLLPCVVLLALAWVAVRRLKAKALWHAGLMLLAFAAVMTPWVVRNWHASGGHVVLTTLRAGASLYESLNPKADGGPMLNCVNEVPRPPGMSEFERDRQLRRLALAYAAEHPGRVAWLALRKLGRFWNVVPNAREFRSLPLAAAVAVPYVLVMLLAAVGLVRVWRRGPGMAPDGSTAPSSRPRSRSRPRPRSGRLSASRGQESRTRTRSRTSTRNPPAEDPRHQESCSRAPVALILLLPVLYHSILHTVFVGSIRYRVAVMPLVIVLAAHGLVGLWTTNSGELRKGKGN